MLSPYLSQVSLNRICCSLKQKEMDDLVKYVSQRYLPDRPQQTFPDGVIIKQLLELYILFWMQEGIMDLMNLSVLVEGLEFIGRPQLKNVLLGATSPAPTFESSGESLTGGHSKVVPLSSLTGIPSSFEYPNGKGVCVIFNQEQFLCRNPNCGLSKMNYHGVRFGSSVDADNLQNVFDNFY